MKHVFEAWGCAIRGLVLQVPEGPKSSPVDLDVPEDLLPPSEIPMEENGFIHMHRHLSAWPQEGEYPVDLEHRFRQLEGEKFAAQQAIQRLLPLMEGLESILEKPDWLAWIASDAAAPYFSQMERIGIALLIRARLEDAPHYRTQAIALGRRILESKGGFYGFFPGVRILALANTDLSDLDKMREQATRWELARVVIPRLNVLGPWDTLPWKMPASWTDEMRAVRWLLKDHPNPYDISATYDALVQARPMLANGTSAQLRAGALEIAAAWPVGLRPAQGKPIKAPALPALYQARPKLLAIENPYGLLQLARWMAWAGSAAEWSEILTGKTKLP